MPAGMARDTKLSKYGGRQLVEGEDPQAQARMFWIGLGWSLFVIGFPLFNLGAWARLGWRNLRR